MNLDLPKPQTTPPAAPSVFVAVPAYYDVPAAFCFSFAMLMMHAQKMLSAGLLAGLQIRQRSLPYIPLARQRLAQEAVNSSCSHVLWLDADMAMPQWALQRLLQLDLDIVGASYPKKFIGDGATTMRLQGKRYEPHVELQGNAPFEVDAIGCGVLLIRTDVYRRLAKPWYQQLVIGDGSEEELTDVIGEDVYFCQQAKAAGFKILCDPVVTRWCGHVGAQMFTFGPDGRSWPSTKEFGKRLTTVTLDEAKALPPCILRDNRL